MHQEERLMNRLLMNEEDFNLLKSILQITDIPLKTWLHSICGLKEMGFKEVINDKDFLYAEGDIPILIVCHLDTVFTYPPREIFYDKDSNVMWAPGGAGFDDRAGVMVCLKMFQEIRPLPSFLFCCDEEIGGNGAIMATQKLAEKVKNKFKYIIEVDRRGVKDCVFYDDTNKKFHDYVEKFGFKTERGTFSDISFIAPGWGISAVNLSIGYVDEHTASERLYVGCFLMTYRKILKMLKDADSAEFFKYESTSSYRGFHYHYTGEGRTCDLCGAPLDNKHYTVYSESPGDDEEVSVLCDQCLSLIGDDLNDGYEY